jgi:uncharacterized membrane protein YoaK (UPF0700 family)
MKQAATASLLAFTAGFVDTAGFIALFGLFTAHVTGNFVLIGASFADFHPGILGKLLALPVFILAVAGARIYVLGRERRGSNGARGLLIAELLFLGAFLAAGVAAAPFTEADAPLTILTGQLAVIAMAVQNAASRTAFAKLSPTTVMTGNVTQIVIDMVDFVGAAPAKAEIKARLTKMVPPVLTFALGAMAGALGYVAVGFWCLVAPITSVALIFFLRRSTVSA